jgi:hypothetical protein
LQATFISYEEFKTGLSDRLPKGWTLDDDSFKKSLFRLDEYKMGTISITSIEYFSGTESFLAKVAGYVARSWLPLIIWVDDNPANNELYVSDARKAGLTVFEFRSTAEAKMWIDENLGSPISVRI